MLSFIIGLFSGGLFGIATMCLIQINREDNLSEAEKGMVKE